MCVKISANKMIYCETEWLVNEALLDQQTQHSKKKKKKPSFKQVLENHYAVCTSL